MGAVFGLFVWLAAAVAGPALPTHSGARTPAISHVTHQITPAGSQVTRHVQGDGAALERSDGAPDDRAPPRVAGAGLPPVATPAPASHRSEPVLVVCPDVVRGHRPAALVALPMSRAPPRERATV